MGYSVLDCRLGYLVERYAVGVRGLKVQYLFQVPGYSFSLAVLIGGEPDSVSLAGFLAKRVDPKNFSIVLAFAGDSTITKFLLINLCYFFKRLQRYNNFSKKANTFRFF